MLHTGDADPRSDNFALLRELPRVDLAILPFWFVLDEPNRAFVRESIAPRRIFAMHLPPADAAAVGVKLRDAGVDAALPSAPGAVVRFAQPRY